MLEAPQLNIKSNIFKSAESLCSFQQQDHKAGYCRTVLTNTNKMIQFFTCISRLFLDYKESVCSYLRAISSSVTSVCMRLISSSSRFSSSSLGFIRTISFCEQRRNREQAHIQLKRGETGIRAPSHVSKPLGLLLCSTTRVKTAVQLRFHVSSCCVHLLVITCVCFAPWRLGQVYSNKLTRTRGDAAFALLFERVTNRELVEV